MTENNQKEQQIYQFYINDPQRNQLEYQFKKNKTICKEF